MSHPIPWRTYEEDELFWKVKQKKDLGGFMPYAIVLWFAVFVGVMKTNVDEIKAERQTVKLFEHTEYGYHSYYVKADK